MNDKELYSIIGFIKISPIRETTIKSIENSIKMPSEISRETGYRTTQISGALIDLKEKNLVVCLNKNAHKGRLYTTTDYGKEIMRHYKNLI